MSSSPQQEGGRRPLLSESSGILATLMLVRRLKTGSLVLTLVVLFAAPLGLVLSYLIGWEDLGMSVREWNRYAPLGLIAVLLCSYAALTSLGERRLYHHIEDALAEIRIEIAHLYGTSELPVVQGLGAGTVESIVNGDARLVSAMAFTMTVSVEAMIIVIVGISFVGYQSLAAVGLFIVMAVALNYFRKRHGDVVPLLHAAEKPEARFRNLVGDILGGHRELLLDRPKAKEAADDTEAAERAAADLHSKAALVYGGALTLVQVISALFVITYQALTTDPFKSLHVTAAIVVVLALVQTEFSYVLMYQEELHGAARAIHRLLALEAGLRSAPRVKDSATQFGDFDEIRLSGISLVRPPRERGGKKFQLGPTDVSIRRGTVTVIRGTNGSGKSTFIDLLLGVIKAGAGEIFVDGQLVGASTIASYRALFSPVFAKPHLYGRLFGYEDFDKELAEDWIDRLILPEDIRLDASEEQSTALSTGQRKRLALARAIVEGRPILVLDEFAADQDVDARARFYSEILPRLKEEGRTVVAVIHEEIRPACVDQVLHMVNGKLVAEGGPATG
jgi:putative ATP-binding cassette transporter